jgi:hypothetical protein
LEEDPEYTAEFTADGQCNIYQREKVLLRGDYRILREGEVGVTVKYLVAGAVLHRGFEAKFDLQFTADVAEERLLLTRGSGMVHFGNMSFPPSVFENPKPLRRERRPR